jgi:hypothetical protein
MCFGRRLCRCGGCISVLVLFARWFFSGLRKNQSEMLNRRVEESHYLWAEAGLLCLPTF